MNPDDLLYGMRTDAEQTDAAITAFVAGVSDGTISRPQAAAWLAWAYRRGLTDRETVALTRAMTHSGDVLEWPEGTVLIDKHSTGGVGDKVSLILAPLWAALGMRVPMISGRGLGHTGGTLDKLESIPGFRTDLEEEALRRVLEEVGCFITGQTRSLAPADRVLYGLRNETCTVESIPLIVSSILSKKLAEGVERLVLDVKTGSGAFMQTLDDSLALARTMVRVAQGYGVRCTAAITAMDRPLGRAIGNAVEVEESIACLRGEGPPDLRELVLALADHPDAEQVLDSGAAYDTFAAMVEAQGGTLGALRDPGADRHEVVAERSGFLSLVDARSMGRAAFVLGAGRRRAEDGLDYGVGIWMGAALGDEVRAGQPLATLLHRRGRCLDEAIVLAGEGLQITDAPPEVPPLVHDIIFGLASRQEGLA